MAVRPSACSRSTSGRGLIADYLLLAHALATKEQATGPIIAPLRQAIWRTRSNSRGRVSVYRDCATDGRRRSQRAEHVGSPTRPEWPTA